jgi:hypothetical protein
VVPGSSNAPRRGVANRRRDGVEEIAIDDELRGVVADVHGRRAGNRDGFFERADLQLLADRRGERTLNHDAFAANRLETGQRERRDVGSRRQVDDAVVA